MRGVPVSASGDMAGGTVRSSSACCCAATVPGAAAKAAAPAAALFRKFRRSTVNFFGLNITIHLCPAFTYNLYHTLETGRHWRGRGWGRGCTCGTLYFGAVDAPPTRGYVESSTRVVPAVPLWQKSPQRRCSKWFAPVPSMLPLLTGPAGSQDKSSAPAC